MALTNTQRIAALEAAVRTLDARLTTHIGVTLPLPTPTPTWPRGFLLHKEHTARLDANDLSALREGQHIASVRWVPPQLHAAIGRDTFTATELADIEASFVACEQARVPMQMRGAYWYNDGAYTAVDVPLPRAKAHIDQIAAIAARHPGVLWALDGAWYGKWGEQHYDGVATQYQTYGERGQSKPEKWELIRYLVDTFKVPVALRYPQDIMDAWNILPESYHSMLAHHNDALLTEYGEWGTWDSQAQRDWMRTVFFATPRIFVGEFGEITSYNAGAMAIAYLSLQERQLRLLSWDSGNASNGAKTLLQHMAWGDGGTYWQHTVQALYTSL